MTHITLTSDEEVRFWSKVDNSGSCWEWQGALSNGYGVFGVAGRSYGPHRLAWMMMVGPIPENYEIDHLCRNRACVNPDHLEPVTISENRRRGVQAKTHRKRSERVAELVGALENDYRIAITRRNLADHLGFTESQLDYVLHVDDSAKTAWQAARAKILEDRCATRSCSMCGQTKPKREFPVDRRDGCGIGRRCKTCHRLVMRAYRAAQ